MIEDGIVWGRRAFPEAQRLLGGAVRSLTPELVEVSWHGSARHPETGSFALVGLDSGLDDLIGEVVRVTGPSGRPVFAYVLGSRDVTSALSLARRAFAGMELLARAPVSCVVEVVL